MKIKYFEQTPRCNITIIREDDSIETYGYVSGNPIYAKIEEKNGTMTELTKEDLNQAETWEMPTNYQPETIPYKDMPDDQLMFYYAVQTQKLKVATGWQNLDTKIESSKKIVVSREDFSHDTLSVERQSDDSWIIISDKQKVNVSGKFDFHGAMALAGLILYSMMFIHKEVHQNNNDDWKSEDGTLTPFSIDKNSINYAKDGALDKDLIETWLPFYENTLKVSPANISGSLNTYFQAMGKDL